MHLHWHRRDLRIEDNPGLTLCQDSKTIPLFVLDPTILSYASPPRVGFMLDALEALQERYRRLESDLLLAWGDPTTIVADLATQFDVEVVSWGMDYSGLARRRDNSVQTELEGRNIDHHQLDDAVLHQPETITTNAGNPYKVFSYYSKKWHDREKERPFPPPNKAALGNPKTQDRNIVDVETVDIESIATESIDTRGTTPAPDEPIYLDTVPGIETLGFEQPAATIPGGTPNAAQERLETFCEESIYEYSESRDFPARSATSRLSPHLKYGTIGIRAVYEATESAYDAAKDQAKRESVREFQDQLAWRDFYIQVLWDRPDVVTNNYKQYDSPIEWRDDPEALQSWKDGNTGYPIVDAGMRQLRAEAFMHNRVRMIVASFLTKDLLIDWREGYDWFRRMLVDHDTANDTGGWQWAASTGTDAQPYFRIFNPMTQAKQYDPEAMYIRQYVDELSDVPTDTIHSWDELEPAERTAQAPSYPAPIVDHSDRRDEAIQMFEMARDG